MSRHRAPHAVLATQHAVSIRVRRVASNVAACGAGRVAGALENAKTRRVQTGHVSRHAPAKSLKSFFYRNRFGDEEAACDLDSRVDADGAVQMPCDLGSFAGLDDLQRAARVARFPCLRTHQQYEFNPIWRHHRLSAERRRRPSLAGARPEIAGGVAHRSGGAQRVARRREERSVPEGCPHFEASPRLVRGRHPGACGLMVWYATRAWAAGRRPPVPA